MPRRKTHAEYENELFQREIDYYPLEEYQGSEIPILHECLKEHKWKVRPKTILEGHGCPTCAGNKKKTLEEYNAQLKDRHISALTYISHKDTATHLCGVCNSEWTARPIDVLAGTKCPSCSNAARPGGYNKTRFLRDRELATSPGILYCVVLVNKETSERVCLKIGITKGTSNLNVLKRIKGFTGYEARVQKLVYGTLEEVFDLEQELHLKWALKKYKSPWKFGGHSELFELDNDIVRSIPKTL